MTQSTTAPDLRAVTAARRLHGVAWLCDDLAALGGEPAVDAQLADTARWARREAGRLDGGGEAT